MARKPITNDWIALPAYANESAIPVAVAAAFLPPKSAVAVPDMMECTPITAIMIVTAEIPMTSIRYSKKNLKRELSSGVAIAFIG